jgi:hypothetical protein
LTKSSLLAEFDHQRHDNLQSHAVNDKLHGEVLSIRRHAVGELGNIGIVLAVLVNEVPEDLVQDCSPDSSDSVDSAHAVGGLVGVGVGGHAGAVGVSSDAGGLVGGPVTHDLVGRSGVLRLEVDGNGHEITPAFAHTTRFATGETSCVGGTTSKTVGHYDMLAQELINRIRKLTSVGVLVNNDTSIEATVSLRGRSVPEVHPHASILTISRRSKVGVVSATSILSVKDHHIVTLTTLVVVVDLEVSSLLSETEDIQKIVVLVGSVEQLGDGSIAVRGGVGHGSGVVVLELEGLGVRAVVVQVAASTGGVDLGNTVITTGGGVVAGAVAEPGELG